MSDNLFLIGNAHLDPVWQWKISEGLSLIRSTFRSALDRMKENANYKFTSACAGYYYWIQQVDPDMFEEIRQRVAEGRWGIAGGMWVQPDCNIPSGEAFCRHLLYSQHFFKRNFGQITDVGYNVDSFGHSAALPQILRKSRIRHYVYMRPNRETEAPYLPKENLHKWVGPDGSEVNAFRILELYNGDLSEERVDLYRAQPQDQMVFYGIGNHGGGPSKEHLAQAEERIKTDGTVYAVPHEYFEAVDGKAMPVVSGDLKHHAPGCYSANSRVKSENRRAECELVRAEIFDTLSSMLLGDMPHNEAIQKAWQRVLFNQFHDILAGCCIKEAYTNAYHAFGYARQAAGELSDLALQKIAGRIKTTDFLDADPSEMRDRLWYREGEGSPMVVFNPHPFPVHSTICFGSQYVSRVMDPDGKDVPFQLIRAPYSDGSHLKQCMFEVELPSLGYRVYYLYKKTENGACASFETDLTATDSLLENEKVRITFDKESGSILSYYLKEAEREFSQGDLCKAIVCDDSAHDTWSHGMNTFNDDLRTFGEGSLTLIENGPLRATIKSVTKSGRSVLKRYYSLYKNDSRLHIRCILDVDEEYALIRFSFPVRVDSPRIVYSMPFGFIDKDPDGTEDIAHEWVDLIDCETHGGMGLINDSRCSYCAIGNDLRVTAARSCAYLDHYAQPFRDEEMEFIDKGEHEFNFILCPHTEDVTEELTNLGKLLNMPPVLVEESHHDGSLPQTYSALKLDQQNISLSALKGSEDGEGLILRLCETAGRAADAAVTLPVFNRCLSLHFLPHEIKTIRFTRDGLVKEEPIIEF